MGDEGEAMVGIRRRDPATGAAGPGGVRRGAWLAAAVALAVPCATLLARPGAEVSPGLAARLLGEPAAIALPPWPGGPDHDGDGVASGADALPFLGTDHADADGDGYGDSQDRFPHDPERARPVELVADGGFDTGTDGWTAEPGDGTATWLGDVDPGGGGALALAPPAGDGDDAPRWVGAAMELDPDAAVLHVTGRVRASGAAAPRLGLAVRNRDPMGTHTVSRDVPLGDVVPDEGATVDGWTDFSAAVELPSRPVSVELVASVDAPAGTAGTVMFDDLGAHAVLGGDTDADGVDDPRDPDDDGDGFLDGEDPAPLDAGLGPVARIARVASPGAPAGR